MSSTHSIAPASDKPFLRRAGHAVHVVKPVEHVATISYFSSITAMAWASSMPACCLSPSGILAQGGFEALCDADIVHDEPGGLCLEIPD